MIKAQTSWLFIIMFWNMSENHPLLDFFAFVILLTAFVPVDLLTLTTQVYHIIWSLFAACCLLFYFAY